MADFTVPDAVSRRLGTLTPGDPQFVSAEDLLNEPASQSLVFLGLPTDQNSSSMRGLALAPPVVCAALGCCSESKFNDVEVDVVSALVEGYVGDVHLHDDGSTESRERDRAEICRAAEAVTRNGAPLLCVGGDQSVSFPLVQALSRRAPVHILHFGASSNLYHSPENPFSHRSPFARILERGLAVRLVQLGVRSMDKHEDYQVKRFGNVEVVTVFQWPARPSLLAFPADASLYISVSLDALDPASAPGVSQHRPGGLSTRELLVMLRSVEAPGGILGGDVVEYNPMRDLGGATAMVAAEVLKELVQLICRWPAGLLAPTDASGGTEMGERRSPL